MAIAMLQASEPPYPVLSQLQLLFLTNNSKSSSGKLLEEEELKPVSRDLLSSLSVRIYCAITYRELLLKITSNWDPVSVPIYFIILYIEGKICARKKLYVLREEKKKEIAGGFFGLSLLALKQKCEALFLTYFETLSSLCSSSQAKAITTFYFLCPSWRCFLLRPSLYWERHTDDRPTTWRRTRRKLRPNYFPPSKRIIEWDKEREKIIHMSPTI